MVQIAQFKPYAFRPEGELADGESNWGEPTYVAWVIPAAGEGDVAVIPLGDAATIDRLAQDVLFEMAIENPDMNREQQRAAMDRLLPLMKQLAGKILDPLLPYLDEADELIVSPDAGLWLVPWGALPVQRDFLIDRINIRYVVSGRELVVRQPMRVGVSAPVVMADPDYDFSRSQLANAEVARPRAQPSPMMFAMRSMRSLKNAERLKGTAVEANLIAPELERLTRQQPQVFMDQRATEAQVKAAYRPRVLVLSTHGFFFANQKPSENGASALSAASRSSRPQGKNAHVLSNPLLRCGLLFAGCNQNDGDENAGLDDGILTGLEVIGIDLRGTELVVLSACDTGRGDVQCGEGVAGLRQAFQFAGAEAVASSLWKIPDEATVPLMQAFFRNLSDGKSKAAALCDAQRAMIEHRRGTLGTAHPFYWAAFTLTGR
ncbi:MAG: CHAT domain-containing protein [Pirellulaceae bacterium]